jgi:spore coat polysaccharide biosynthesis protein SpsF
MLQVIIERVRGAAHIDELIVATTTLEQDDRIAALARELDAPCFRGAENDCLSRCYQAAVAHAPDTVVRLTGDNPIVDGEFVDDVLEVFARGDWDFASTSLKGTYPLGLSVEAMSLEALEVAWREDKDPARREHVTPFIYLHPERFKILALDWEEDSSDLRWTVDTPEDLSFVGAVFGRFGRFDFSWRDVIELIGREPHLAEINRGIRQRTLLKG